MDRNKPSSARGVKGKITQHPSDLYALGAKPPNSNRDAEAKRNVSGQIKITPPVHTNLASGSKDRKREASAPILPPICPIKKAKVAAALAVVRAGTSTGSTSTDRFGSTGVATASATEPWENVAIEFEEGELVQNVLDSYNDSDMDKVVAYLTGAMRLLRTQRYKPDSSLYLSLIYICSFNSSLFRQDLVTQALCSLLKRDNAPSFKSKGNPLVPILAANLLMKSYRDVQEWPEAFAKCYIEDALGDRVWVDHELCAPFVDNIMTAFNTKPPPKSLLQPELSALGGRGDTSSPLTINEDDLTETGLSKKKNLLEKCSVPVYNRFLTTHEDIESLALEAVKEQLNRRQAPETVTRNFLRFLSSACGFVEIRMIAVSRLEMWLHNAKLMRPAQELLVHLCYNCSATTQRDVEVISQLVKMRLKTKALGNVYLSCVREMISNHPENLPAILKHTIYNELSNARNPNNMNMIAAIFQTSPDSAANVLAEIFVELLLNKDDYLRPLRALLREIVRVLRHDINMYTLCRALIQERKETTATLREFEFRDRVFISIADLICLCMFLAVSPQVKEAAGLMARGDKKELVSLQTFQMTVSKIQRDAVWWLHESVPRVYRPSPQDFVFCLRKILLLEPVESYCKLDLWPQESERNIIMRLTSEVPLIQNTLIRILLIGISKEHPLQPLDTLDFCDPLVKRAAILSSEGLPMLQADKLDIIDLIFNLCTYHHPENITLPVGFTPPQLAISNQYWKGWIILLILAAHNPTTFGSLAWEKYPTLKIFMEMCITNHFSYPPPTMAMCEDFEELKGKELQIAALEKQQILEFETHLAASTITEQTSLLLPQLITMAPTGVSRRPPQVILEQLNALNVSHRLGHLLCRSRRPDFLLDIIQRQGPSQHMPWLADLVQNSEGALSHLPVQCLCEFLLSSGISGERAERGARHKHVQLVNHLQALLMNPSQEPAAACEVLEYFLRRLSSPHCSSRAQAIKGIKLVLQPNDDEAMDVDLDVGESDAWLNKQLPELPHFLAVRPQVVAALRQACQVENDPDHIGSYIKFLARFTANDSLAELSDLVYDMALLIVERSTIITAVLPVPEENNTRALETLQSLFSIYWAFLEKARDNQTERIKWSECQEFMVIRWASGDECLVQMLVIHAMIILLTYGPPSDSKIFNNLLDTWFPLNEPLPKAFLLQTSEEALLIPDWIKLRMIRSYVDRLVDAALIDLDPSQLVLFIQSFGIPVTSMSKLLHTLDAAVITNRSSVGEAVLDKSYMAQLVEVQHNRGATGGQTFVQVLQLQQPSYPEDDETESPLWKKKLPDKSIMKKSSTAGFTSNNVESFLRSILLNEPYKGDLKKDFRSLLKILTTELRNITDNFKCAPITKAIINFFSINCASPSFIQCFISSSQYVMSLLRIMLTKPKFVIADFFTTVAKKMLALTQAVKAPSTVLLKNFLETRKKDKTSDVTIKEEYKNEDPVVVLKNTDIVSFEGTGCKLLKEGLQQHDNIGLVEAMAKMLLDIPFEQGVIPVNYSNCQGSFDKSGLLVDWLATIEPELIGSCPDLQMDLMFSKDVCVKNKRQSKLFRPYLLTLLIHRASWATLHQCIGHLLAECTIRYEPTAVLDFLWALTRNPKLWQGRDKSCTPKHYKPEDILELSNLELKSLVSYMLEEAINVDTDNNCQSSINCIESRLPLLLQCLDDNHSAVGCVSKYLLSLVQLKDACLNRPKIEENVIDLDDSSNDDSGVSVGERRGKMAEKFLLFLYMHIPRVIHYVFGSDKEKILQKANITENSSSVIDKISHCLFTALSSTPLLKDWNRRSQEYELFARKMAAAHPVLVLRQLSMIAASLRGRTHLEFNVFKSRHHLNLFLQTMGILELLEPHIFSIEYQRSLEDTLHAYFSLFRFHGHLKELLTLLNRFIIFLQAYIRSNAKRALKYLQKYAHLLNDLQMMHSHLPSLRDLMTGVLLPHTDSEYNDNDGGDVLMAVAPSVSPEQLPQHWEQLTLSLTKIEGEEVQSALQEIDHLSNRRPAILDSVLEKICKLIRSPSMSVRALALTLLARYLKHSPRVECSSTIVLTAVLKCLNPCNPDVAHSMLEKLPELIVCMQESSLIILEKAFALGMGSDINTVSHINKTISLLNLQTGC